MSRTFHPLALHRRGFLAGAALCLGAAPVRAAPDFLRVAAAPGNLPWERRKTGGDFEGFEVDLVNEIAKRLAMSVEFQPPDGEATEDALLDMAGSGQCDLAIGGIAVTAERSRMLAFTQAYYDRDLALAARIDANLRTVADAKDAAIGAVAASPAEAWVRQHQSRYRFGDYRGYPRETDVLFDLRNGRIDVAVGDITAFRLAFVKSRELAIIQSIPTGIRIAMPMRVGHPLLNPIDRLIAHLKAEGFLARLHKTWIGADADPAGSTVQARMP